MEEQNHYNLIQYQHLSYHHLQLNCHCLDFEDLHLFYH